MSERRPKLGLRYGRNQFAILPPSQTIIAKARRAGVDTTKLPEIEAWRKGKP